MTRRNPSPAVKPVKVRYWEVIGPPSGEFEYLIYDNFDDALADCIEHLKLAREAPVGVYEGLPDDGEEFIGSIKPVLMDQAEWLKLGQPPGPAIDRGRFCDACQRWFPEGYGRHACIPRARSFS